MNHEEIIKSYFRYHFGVREEEVEIIKRLEGGMSNSNYVVRCSGKLYTFRIPGQNAEKFVSRTIEAQILDIVEKIGVDGNLLVRMDQDTGYKLSYFVEGSPLSEPDPAAYYREAAAIMHKIHDSAYRADNDYDPFVRLEIYENYVIENGLTHGKGYADIKAKFLAFQEELRHLPKVLCHNDTQPSNFIRTEKKELLLVDWEFGGNNDPLYDVACYGNNDFKFAVGLLPVYLGHNPTDEEWKRLYLWRTFQCLQWHNVALYKEATGLSAELHLDFMKIAEYYVELANRMFMEAMKYANVG